MSQRDARNRPGGAREGAGGGEPLVCGAGLDRREFLRRGVAATVGLGALSLGPPAFAEDVASREPRVRRRVTLGKTGLEISDISFGSGGLKERGLVEHALERGITYFDTAEGYPLGRHGLAEEILGEALAGVRDRVLLASKTVAKPQDRRDVLMRRLEASLRRLRTDHVDVYFNHAVNDLARVDGAEWREFAQRAREQGKIRFTGMSGHGGNLRDCLDVAIEKEIYDVLLVAHNFGQDPAFYERFTKSFDLVANQIGLPERMQKAKAKGIGVIAMKTLMGAKLNDMRPYEAGGATFAQAAFRWVLSGPDVDALIVSMESREKIDEYLRASGDRRVSRADARLLTRYAALQGASFCRFGCDACESSCPHGVAISEVLRARMYAEDYGDPERGRAEYGLLGAAASACAGCADTPCLGSCPAGLDVPSLTRRTHRTLG